MYIQLFHYMCYVSFPHVTHSLYDKSNIPSTPPHLALTSFSNICHIDKNRKYIFVCVNVCVLAGFFRCVLGAGIVMFRANLPLHCTRNTHNVILARGHRKGERVWGRSQVAVAPTLDFDKHQSNWGIFISIQRVHTAWNTLPTSRS